jgi:hypothetical protein
MVQRSPANAILAHGDDGYALWEARTSRSTPRAVNQNTISAPASVLIR